ncbi:MAG: mannose-1-phosphate guanylyltransferase, partial [Promethearchaeota archaeon]
IIFIETADHYYKNPDHYLQDIKNACKFAENQDKIVLIGIKPTEPHTGYGYIKNGTLIEPPSQKINETAIFDVDSFKEKPDLETAQQYLKSSDYTWNSGMFIAKCSVLLKEIKTYLPDLSEILDKIKESNFDPEILATEFAKSQKISIDYGVMEKSKNTVVLNSSMHWDDIGDFNAIARIINSDKNGNYNQSQDLQVLDSFNNIVRSDKLVALIGVDDLVIIDTPDALLVCKRSETQKIRQLLKKLDDKYH